MWTGINIPSNPKQRPKEKEVYSLSAFFFAKAVTRLCPIPLVPPVTIATFPLKSGISSNLYRFENRPAGAGGAMANRVELKVRLKVFVVEVRVKGNLLSDLIKDMEEESGWIDVCI